MIRFYICNKCVTPYCLHSLWTLHLIGLYCDCTVCFYISDLSLLKNVYVKTARSGLFFFMVINKWLMKTEV